MMFSDNSIKGARSYFHQKLFEHFSSREIDTFFDWSCSDLFNLSKSDILLNETRFSESQLLSFREVCLKLIENIPIQYILGNAHFLDRSYKVNESVLIPRPETEELVALILAEEPKGSLLDIGTGSGVIPIALKLAAPGLDAHSLDVSQKALEVASENATRLGASITFLEMDILADQPISEFDIIVSNPPYVLESDKTEMAQNVLEQEPGIALFVPDEDPLKFYRRICVICADCLKNGGKLYFEIHEKFGSEMHDLVIQYGFEEVKVIKDLQGKSRFISAKKSPSS